MDYLTLYLVIVAAIVTAIPLGCIVLGAIGAFLDMDFIRRL